MPRLGTFNLHASLLPQYRGAAPINWAVINGDTETGITTFFLQHEIDTGKVIQQVRVPIADTDNVEVVHDKLMILGGKLVLETVDAILNDTVKPIAQEDMAVVGELRPAPKIFKETCRIDCHCRLHSSFFDLLNHPMKMRTSLIVNIQRMCAQRFHFRDKLLRIDYHQMYIQRFVRQLCYILQHREAE